MKAKTEYDAGNHKKAVEDLYAAISFDVHNAVNVLNSGGVGPENKSEPCAWYKPDLDQLIKDYPTDYRVFLVRGLHYAVFVRFDNSGKYVRPTVADYNQAAVLNPRSPLPQYFLGRLYLSNLAVLLGTDPNAADRRAKALASYNKAVQIDPHFTEGYFERAVKSVAEKQGNMVIADVTDRKRWRRIGVRRLQRESGLSQKAVYAMLSGRPVRRQTLAILKVIVDKMIG